MAVVVRETTPIVEHVHDDSGNSMGWVVGLILLLVVLFLFFYYGLPIMRSAGTTTNNITPQVNVPGKVDVNVHKTQ